MTGSAEREGQPMKEEAPLCNLCGLQPSISAVARQSSRMLTFDNGMLRRPSAGGTTIAMAENRQPTHVLVATSDGDKLVGERFVTLEEFVDILLADGVGEKLRGWTGPMGPPGRDALDRQEPSSTAPMLGTLSEQLRSSDRR